jgi:hypothetical protein
MGQGGEGVGREAGLTPFRGCFLLRMSQRHPAYDMWSKV